MTLTRIIRTIKARMPLKIQFLIEMMSYWGRLCKYNASVSTDKDIRKMQYSLLRENHVIEKGMSMRNTKKGFGQTKVIALLNRLEKYYNLYGSQDKRFLAYPLTTIAEYISFQKSTGVEVPDIEYKYNQLCHTTGIIPDNTIHAGIKIQKREELQNQAKGDFESLLYSRHSIRYFKKETPSAELLEEALVLASRTPSACNRQAWHTHIYFDNDSHELLKMQSGCNGFYNDIPCSIVVTADMKGFLGHEPFQCFIDGGLYAQNLINALHYVGLGGIPLSCGFLSDKLLRIQKRFNIPENEVMVVIIGTGYMVDEMKIAVSTRQQVSKTNIFHK